MFARPLGLRVAPVKARSARWSAAAVSAIDLGAMTRSVNQLKIPGLAAKSQESKLAQNIVLQIDLADNTEGPQDLQVVEALRYAGTDDRVQGLGLHVGTTGLATIQELREAVSAFRKAKQDAVPTVAYAVAYNTSSYYLASAFDQVFDQAGTVFNFVGFTYEQVFIKRLLKKLKVKVNMFSREQYKDVHNDVVKTGHPPVVRRGIHALLQLQLLQVVVDVAIDKGLSFSQVLAAVNAAPSPAEDAMKQGLIIATKYSSDATHELRVMGNICSDRVQGSDRNIFSRHLCELLQTARSKGSQGKAVVLRINSPGGVSHAAHSVFHEVMKVRESGRPVVACMGNCATSGGYLISAAADRVPPCNILIKAAEGVF